MASNSTFRKLRSWPALRPGAIAQSPGRETALAWARIYTLGGMAIPQPVENPKVYGAATDEACIELLREAEIEIRSNDGGIVGASGLFLGLAVRQGIQGTCLMGETPGYFIDAESAEAILKKLSLLLNFEINVDKLDERAEETRQMIAKAQQMEQDLMHPPQQAGAGQGGFIP